MEHKEKLIFSGIFLLIFSKIGQVFRLASDGRIGAHMILRFSDAFGSALTDRFFDMKLFDFAFGLVCVLCIHAYIYLAQMDMRKRSIGMERNTARLIGAVRKTLHLSLILTLRTT